MSELQLKKQTSAFTQLPPAGYVSIFVDSADGITKYKDENGVIANFNSGVQTVDGQSGTVSLASSYQPLDSDLSQIAALSTTAYGRGLLTLADAPTLTGGLTVSTQTLKGLQSASDKRKQDTGWINAITDIGLDPTGATDGASTLNTFLSSVADSSTIYFPKGSYKFASTVTIPSGKHLAFKGDGGQKSILSTSSATADMIVVSDWYSTFNDLGFTTSVTRTAGYAINAGAMVGIFIQNCNFQNMFNGVLLNGTLCGVAFTNFANSVNFSLQFNGTNVNTYIDNCTFDCAPASVAHIEINQAGSLVISNCDIIHATNNLRFNPTSPNGVFSVYAINTFFDTAGGSSVKFQGTGNVQRAKFVNCWFSGSVNGCEFASTAASLPTAIDFVNCDIYSNSQNGILATAVQDFSLNNCRVAGNATAGVNVSAGAGGVTKFNFQNNTFGPTGGIGGNGTGILIAAGTYGGYYISGNWVSGNTTANITDNGSVTGFNQKSILDNLGHAISGSVASSIAASAAINTTETILVGGLNALPLPANSIAPGRVIRIALTGNCTATAAVANTFRVRLGTAGTVADTAIGTVALTGATGTAIQFKTVIELTVRTVGATATFAGTAQTVNAGATGLVAATTNIQALTAASASTAVNSYLSVTFQSAATTSTVTFQTALVEIF